MQQVQPAQDLDHHYMTRALLLASHGRFTTTPNPNVGSVVVRGGQIVGEGYHQRAGEAHAEIHALKMAGELARGATLYITLEPCCHQGRTPPCVDAILAAGITRVVVAMADPNPQVSGRGLYLLRKAGVEIEIGVLHQEAEQLNLGFFKRMRTGFPYLRLKLASSLDGKTAMASGESQWITSAQARQDAQRFRAESCAILSTSATVLADDPALTVRWQELDAQTQQLYPQAALRQPIRIIIDSQFRISPVHRIIQQAGLTWLIRSQAAKRSQQAEHRNTEYRAITNVEEIILASQSERVDLVSLMMVLGKRGINTLWVEAGAHLAGALLQAGLVDELVLYLAPKLLGSDALGLCHLPGLHQLTQAPLFQIEDVCQIGPDLRLILKVAGIV